MILMKTQIFKNPTSKIRKPQVFPPPPDPAHAPYTRRADHPDAPHVVFDMDRIFLIFDFSISIFRGGGFWRVISLLIHAPSVLPETSQGVPSRVTSTTDRFLGARQRLSTALLDTRRNARATDRFMKRSRGVC